MSIVLVPDYIYDQITKRLDAAISEHPDAEKDRALLRSEIVSFVDKFGYVPEFSLRRREPK